MSDVYLLINTNIHFLKQGKALLKNLSDEQYQFFDSPYFSSSAGRHIRHVLDHYVSFLDGCESKVNYDARKRDERIEKDRDYAAGNFQQCINRLMRLTEQLELDQSIRVQSNEVGDHDSWSTSSVKRELQFLIGHTVHHYALVNFILRVQDFLPPAEFGIAPSTLKYEQQSAQTS